MTYTLLPLHTITVVTLFTIVTSSGEDALAQSVLPTLPGPNLHPSLYSVHHHLYPITVPSLSPVYVRHYHEDKQQCVHQLARFAMAGGNVDVITALLGATCGGPCAESLRCHLELVDVSYFRSHSLPRFASHPAYHAYPYPCAISYLPLCHLIVTLVPSHTYLVPSHAYPCAISYLRLCPSQPYPCAHRPASQPNPCPDRVHTTLTLTLVPIVFIPP